MEELRLELLGLFVSKGKFHVPDIRCPRYSICNLKKSHLDGLSFNPAYQNFSKYFLQLGEVVMLCFAIDNYIINVEYHKIIQVVEE